MTSGPANRACALIGTISSASTSGQTTGPPAENAYAVDPVGVAHTTPSHPHRDSGRPSISVTTSIIRSRATFSTLASFSAQVVAVTVPFCRTVTSTVIRCSTVYRRLITRSMTSGRSSCSASARKPTWPRFTPSSGTPAGLVISATRSSVPSPPRTITISVSRAASGVARTTSAPGQRNSSASVSTIRTEIPAASSMPTTSRALPVAAARPVCAITSTVRGPVTGVLP